MPAAASANRPDPGSFRDPDGRLYSAGEELYRALTPDALERLQRFYAHPAATAVAPWLVPTELKAAPPGTGLSGTGLVHRRLRPLTYCYE